MVVTAQSLSLMVANYTNYSPINYEIKADVFNIQYDHPRRNDSFLIDTNVLYWFASPLGRENARVYQLEGYPPYIKNALSSRSSLLRCDLSMAELAHTIESDQRNVFIRSNGRITTKQYRHNHVSERATVVNAVKGAWRVVESMSRPVEFSLSESLAQSALNKLSELPVDGYDVFILEALAEKGLNKVITDDGDFATVPGIQVFTCNRNVLSAAKDQGRLKNRRNY